MRRATLLFGAFTAACGSGAPPPPAHVRQGPTLGPRSLEAICLADVGTDEPFPDRLSDTACFTARADSTPLVAADLVPYVVQAPLWTDGAEKDRWIVLPPGERIRVDADRLVFPERGMIIKNFSFDGVPVETRFMRFDAGRWRFATYRWQDDARDAARLTKSDTREVAGAHYAFPSNIECTYCHSNAAGDVLAFGADQLGGAFDYDGVVMRQLDALVEAGVIEGDAVVDVVPDYRDTSLSLGQRARAYLHANCAHCHQPGGWSSPSLRLDLRYSVPNSKTGLCDDVQFFRPRGTKRIVPGDPSRSDLLERIRSTDPLERMPPIGVSLPDTAGVAILDAWVLQLSGCE